MENQTILILDFGGQYKELIARCIRDMNIFAVVKSGSISSSEVKEINPIGIILTGGPNSVYGDSAVDDEGVPIFTAKGGISDIEVYDSNATSLFEVTLLRSRQQAILEMPAITRHLLEKKEKCKNEYCFSVFIAPIIHKDSLYMINFSKFHYNVDIVPFTFDEFINEIKEIKSLPQIILN